MSVRTAGPPRRTRRSACCSSPCSRSTTNFRIDHAPARFQPAPPSESWPSPRWRPPDVQVSQQAPPRDLPTLHDYDAADGRTVASIDDVSTHRPAPQLGHVTLTWWGHLSLTEPPGDAGRSFRTAATEGRAGPNRRATRGKGRPRGPSDGRPALSDGAACHADSIKISAILVATDRGRRAMDPVTGPSARRTTTRTVTRTTTWTRPHRVVRTPTESAAVWRPRRRAYAVSTAVWIAMACFGFGVSSALLTSLAGAAATLSAAVVVKASILIRSAEAEGSRQPAFLPQIRNRTAPSDQ